MADFMVNWFRWSYAMLCLCIFCAVINNAINKTNTSCFRFNKILFVSRIMKLLLRELTKLFAIKIIRWHHFFQCSAAIKNKTYYLLPDYLKDFWFFRANISHRNFSIRRPFDMRVIESSRLNNDCHRLYCVVNGIA